MTSRTRKSGGIVVGMGIALMAGLPAIADDTELLLLRPDDPLPTPNVLFIVDSSGSMRAEQRTRAVYDSGITYPVPGANGCDPGKLYWSEVDVTPSCDPANERFVDKAAFLCQYSERQLSGMGRYAGLLAQYRDGSSSGFSTLTSADAERWQKLEPGNNADFVECARDFGKHGDGSSTSLTYPRRGGDTDMFTDDESQAVDWGSFPTSQSVTVWDGNYLNYLQDETFIDARRLDIVKDVSTAVLNSIDNVNVALMRFNENQGGPVIKGMTSVDTNRADIIAAIESIDADGATPLSETFYEAALYWRGMTAYYGNRINEHPTDPVALASVDPEVYRQPAFDTCARNFNIVLTDGVPTDDTEAPELVDSLPDWFDTVGYSGCTGTNMGDCLDDLAAYLHDADISNDPGTQNVITHTIGFTVDLPILQETADRGNGTYFQASDVETLTVSLLEIVSNISSRSLSFASPAVTVNSFNRTQNLNDLYMTTFAASEKTRWPGNVKKYRIRDSIIVDRNGVPAVNNQTGFFNETAQSYWSAEPDGSSVVLGGAVENLPDAAARRLFTDNISGTLTATGNQLTPANANAFTLADFGLTGSAEEPTVETLIRWARGEDVLDEDSDPATSERKFMGDPLHSQPAAVVYGGSDSNPEVVVFAATNDGYVHAIDGRNGQELWAFIPKEHLSGLVRLFYNQDSSYKNYGVDGDIVPVVADRDNDGIIEPADGDFVHIVFGMRRGGSALYSLDVTNKLSPKVNWRVSASSFGQSWSRPTIARIDIDASNFSASNPDKAVVVVGGGYDPVHDTTSHPSVPDAAGAGVYMLDLHSGDIIWRAGPDNGAQLTLDPDIRAGLSRSIPNQIRVIDLDGDNFADRMYASDTGGQILRFDIFKGRDPDGFGADALVTGGVVAQLGAEGLAAPSDEETRRFFTAPDVSIFNDNIQNRRYIAISIGSGYRPHPLDNTPVERFFSIRDRAVFNQYTQAQYNSLPVITEADLVEVGGSVGTVVGQDQSGWMLTLPPNQKVLSTSTTFNNEVFFVAFAPDNAAAETCSASVGRNFLYRVSVFNGDPIVNNLDNVVAGTEDQLRVTELRQGGIAPSPRFLFPSPDDPDCEGQACSPPPLGCIGVECFDPGFRNIPVRTLWSQDGVE